MVVGLKGIFCVGDNMKKNLNTGKRIISLAGKNRSGAGVHKNSLEKRSNNPRKRDWV